MERPRAWIAFVNESERESELEDLRSSAQRGRPFGSEDWMVKIAQQLGFESTPSFPRFVRNVSEKTPFIPPTKELSTPSYAVRRARERLKEDSGFRRRTDHFIHRCKPDAAGRRSPRLPARRADLFQTA
jgi:hypothetical protein